MSNALPGEHYCLKHQGNEAHYAEHNCTVCTLERDLARLTKENEALRKVLRGIANATRFDRQAFDDDTAFVDWAQNVARHALKEGS